MISSHCDFNSIVDFGRSLLGIGPQHRIKCIVECLSDLKMNHNSLDVPMRKPYCSSRAIVCPRQHVFFSIFKQIIYSIKILFNSNIFWWDDFREKTAVPIASMLFWSANEVISYTFRCWRAKIVRQSLDVSFEIPFSIAFFSKLALNCELTKKRIWI